VEAALVRLETAELAARISEDGHPERWTAAELKVRETMLASLELHGPHDLRHTFATWLEDAGIPSRVIDELMGHATGLRRDGSTTGPRYRHTTPEMEARAVAAIEQRLAVALPVAGRGSSHSAEQ
jgi:integrase